LLFRAGERNFKFDVIRSGAVDIVDRSSGAAHVILTHEVGEFTGDLANLTGRTSNVDGVARGTTEVYEICETDLRRIISERPDLSDLILRTFIVRAQSLSDSGEFTGLRVIGERFSSDTFRLRDFLSKNHVLYTFFDIKNDAEKIDALLNAFDLREADLPVVGYGCDWLLKNPTNDELARHIGIKHEPVADRLFDLAIIGGGPAGLAAAVYGASEGLKTIVIEQIATGGQAGTSSKIENYLGFPTGLSGAELAERATIQADKFGADFLLPSQVTRVEFADHLCILETADGPPVRARSIIVATGANYLKLSVPGREKFDGAGVYYAATAMEAHICGGDSVVVVGGGNSAGQACVFLSETAHKVYLLIRGDDLGKNMSDYLAQRIYQTKNIELLKNTEITEMFGGTHLETVEIKNNQTNETKKISVAGVFSFIGAVPRTDWLNGAIELDNKGFIKTGTFIDQQKWQHPRSPFYLETSRPGVFAAGDVRCNSVKRVASSVGEGSMAVTFAHQYLAEQKTIF
jgi:thioredoxin reductase (NADPH)